MKIRDLVSQDPNLTIRGQKERKEEMENMKLPKINLRTFSRNKEYIYPD